MNLMEFIDQLSWWQLTVLLGFSYLAGQGFLMMCSDFMKWVRSGKA
jgi:hypothetical protein